MIKITADSTCDLSKDLLNQFNISIMPLQVLVDGEPYQDGITIQPQDIFTYMGEQNKKVTTSAVNTFEYEQFFKPFADEFEAVIHISLGSHFSSSWQNAQTASQSFNNVYVIDSQNLSTGSGHLVYDAALAAQEGLPAEDIVRQLNETVPKVRASFVIYTMEYLKKGGRCSSLEAFGAALLKIKPSIEVKDGQMVVGKKYRGTFENCLNKYTADQLQQNNQLDKSRIFITHAGCPAETVEKVKLWIEQHAAFAEIVITEAGSTISAHCGPNTLGILYKVK